MKVLFVEAGMKPRETEMESTLEAMQDIVGGCIQAIYPFEEAAVALVCHGEGKDFENLLVELDQYHANVKKHYQEFETVKAAWAKIMVALNA